jgi:hypothetical protein
MTFLVRSRAWNVPNALYELENGQMVPRLQVQAAQVPPNPDTGKICNKIAGIHYAGWINWL